MTKVSQNGNDFMLNRLVNYTQVIFLDPLAPNTNVRCFFPPHFSSMDIKTKGWFIAAFLEEDNPELLLLLLSLRYPSELGFFNSKMDC